MSGLPQVLQEPMRKAKRLEWWTLIGISTIVVVMYFAMGSSQAMKTAFLEDMLGMVPAITFLISSKLEPKEPTRHYPWGFVRVNSLAFLASAVVLASVGLWLLYDGAMGLMAQEHPTIGAVSMFGHVVWLGWIMIAALAYSIIIPLVLGHLKKPVAEKMADKVLHTDAAMQKADWQTGVTGILGIAGVGLGFWWADSAAAAFISLSIIADGFKNIRVASAELLDGMPRELDGSAIDKHADELKERLEQRWPGAKVRLRQSGRYILADVNGIAPPEHLPNLKELMPGDEPWRLVDMSFTPPGGAGDAEE